MLLYAVTSLSGTGARKTRLPKARMNLSEQVASLLVQPPVMVERCADTAQAATVSALVMSWSALRSCTTRPAASDVNPSTVGSLNTAATGAALSPKRSTVDAANWAAVRRRSTRGPGLLSRHALAAGRLLGSGLTVVA